MIIIDSNVWIFSEVDNSPEREIALKKINEALNSGTVGLNVVILSEIYHNLSKLLGASEASKRTIHILEQPLTQWLEFSEESSMKAIKTALDLNIRINDAFTAQQALEMHASVLTDNVKHLKKVRGLGVIDLR